MAGNIEGDGWVLIRPRPDQLPEYVSFDDLVPQADWFWSSLQRYCVPGCCGLDAYEFSAESVAWACGWGTVRPEAILDWRDDNPGDPHELAVSLRAAAEKIRRIDAAAVTATLFNDILTPESYANLMDDLAAKVEPPT